MPQKPLTPKQRQALELLRDHQIDSPTQFARLMWPDADGWRRVGRCGLNGSTRGVGMRLGAGGYLGRLRKAGFIDHSNRLTPAGHAALESED